MRNTHIFRQAIREAMIKHGVTFKSTYTDKVKGDTWGSRRRRVCFYNCAVPPGSFQQFVSDVKDADGYVTGVWGRPNGHTMCNVRGLVE